MNARPALSTSDLSKQQKLAIQCEDPRVLILAGAGAGKTRTLLQKILYLVQQKGIKPHEIVAITFTKNATNEIVDRLLLAVDHDSHYRKILEDKELSPSEINRQRRQKMQKNKWVSRLTIRTFHSLCYAILRGFGAREFDNRFKIITNTKQQQAYEFGKLAASETQYEILHKMLIKKAEDRLWLLKFKRFILDYMVDRIHLPQRQFLHSYPEGKYYTTLKGEKVRSKSEQYIADWLYRHHLSYVYEPKVKFSNVEFRPDFYIPAANIYLEHLSHKSAPIAGKEKEFSLGGRTLVRTYEEMTRDSALFNLSLSRIIKDRLPAQYDVSVALRYEEEMRGRHKEVRDFLRQVIRVLEMCQADDIRLETIAELLQDEQHERVKLFYDCALPLIESYRKYCIEKSYLDFNQLISKSIDLLRNHRDIQTQYHDRYKYVLVDEFQDVNKMQIRLLKNLMNPEAQLFCVGDDWQSIYGFRGSDVKYIVEFSKFFKASKIFQLSTNYRSNDKIVKASNKVIAHNKYKVDKKIKAASKSKRKITVYAGTDADDSVMYSVGAVQDLLKAGTPADQILFLYRRSKMFDPYRKALHKAKLKVKSRTIHAAKGLESEVVFIIGLTEGSGGFPDVWMGDRIYQIIRPTRYDILLEEERRLFYVAITRAKERLYLITELGVESSFITEIPDSFKVTYSTPLVIKGNQQKKCSSCQIRLERYYRFCPNCGEPAGTRTATH